jgi:hypothetical protein
MVSCPSCRCPVKLAESTCPHCGAGVRTSDGTVARTAVAVMLGLSSAALGSACSATAPKYGVPATEEPVTQATASSSALPSSTLEPPQSAPEYGVPATNDPMPSAAPSAGPPVVSFYGVAGTPSK